MSLLLLQCSFHSSRLHVQEFRFWDPPISRTSSMGHLYLSSIFTEQRFISIKDSLTNSLRYPSSSPTSSSRKSIERNKDVSKIVNYQSLPQLVLFRRNTILTFLEENISYDGIINTLTPSQSLSPQRLHPPSSTTISHHR